MHCDLQIFSGCVCHLEQLHAQSPFLFPIVFSINFFFFSLPLLLVMPHTSHLQERSPTSIALFFFLQSCLDAHCVLAYIASSWPLDIAGSFTNFTSLALQTLVFRQLSIESVFIIWPTGVNCTLSLRAVPFSAS